MGDPLPGAEVGAAEANEPDELWVAARPALPPAPGLGPVLAVEGPREQESKRLGYACMALVVVAAVLVLVDVLLPLVLVALLGAPCLYLYLTARRAFVAVGDGWWLTRAEAFGRERWSTFDDLQSVRVRAGANRTAYLELRSPTGRSRFHSGLSGPVTRELARQVLASDAEVDAGAESLLAAWAGSGDPSREHRRGQGPTRLRRSRRRSAGRRGPRSGGWQLGVSGVMLVLGGSYAFSVGWHDFRIHHDPDAVRVVAVVDGEARSCGRGGCRWTSYGHYVVRGQAQEGVEVASGRRQPARGPQTILVNPARPADAVNVDESPRAELVLGVGAVAVGGLFLGLWSRPLLRTTRRRPSST